MDKEIKEELVDKVNQYSQDEEVVALYSAYTKEELERNTLIEDAEKEGLLKGIEQGTKQSKMEIAKNLLKREVPMDIIMESTGLSKKKIEELVGKVNQYSKNEEVVALYSAYTKEELERNTLIEDAEEKGIQRSKMEIAKNLLGQNIGIEVIVKATGLMKEEIEELKDSF